MAVAEGEGADAAAAAGGAAALRVAYEVGRCRLTGSKFVLKGHMLSALE